MAEIDISSDLAAVTEQIQKGIEELQELDGKRQTLAQQIQNLNGVAMYLRGKLPPEEQPTPVISEEESETAAVAEESEDNLVRSNSYPNT